MAAAKVVADFAKTNDKLVIRGGVGGKALDANGVKQVGQHSPSRKCCWPVVWLAIADFPHRRGAGRVGGKKGEGRSCRRREACFSNN